MAHPDENVRPMLCQAIAQRSFACTRQGWQALDHTLRGQGLNGGVVRGEEGIVHRLRTGLLDVDPRHLHAGWRIGHCAKSHGAGSQVTSSPHGTPAGATEEVAPFVAQQLERQGGEWLPHPS